MKISRVVLVMVLMSVALPFSASAIDPTRELIVGMGRYDVELNPYKSIYAHEMQIFTALYEGLFIYDPQSLEPIRAQAESFSKSGDGKTWTFIIRSDARWSDGTSVTATDFVESWLYLLNPQTKAEYAIFFDIIQGAKAYRTGRNTAAASVGIRAQDTRTLVIELDSPAAYFTRLLCHSAFVPIHRSLRGVRTWKPERVIGNGPFRLESMDTSSLMLKRNDRYWDAENVAIPGIQILFLETEQEATARYNDGEIDWLSDMADLDALPCTDCIQFSPMFATGYYFWNCAIKPWDNAHVRRALALLIPWDKIRTDANYFAPTGRLVLPFAGYESPEGIVQQDESEAMQLLKDAGYPLGEGLPSVRFISYESASNDANIAIIAEAWKEVGIELEHIVVPSGDSIRDIRQKGYELSFTSWIGDFADPAAFLLMWTSDSGLNEGGYVSTEFDALISRSMNEDGKERLETLAKAEDTLLSEAPLLPLYHSISFNIIDIQAITGWHQNPLDIHPFKAMGFGIPKARPYVVMAGDAP